MLAFRYLGALFFYFLLPCAAPNPMWFFNPLLQPRNGTLLAKRQQDPSQLRLSTCGYRDGNPDVFRTANSGFECRFDSQNGLWGYCPKSVIQASDCGLAGACIDQADCSNGCGKTKQTKLTTFTCGTKEYCSTALLNFDANQAYTYIACGSVAETDNYLISPTPTPSSTSTPNKSSTSTAQPSQTAPSGAKSTTTPNTSSTSPLASSVASSPWTSTSSGTASSSGPSVTSSSPVSPNAGSSSGGSSHDNNTPAIIGGVLGGLALIGIFVLAAIYLMRRDKAAKRKTMAANDQRLGQPVFQDTDEAKQPAANRLVGGGWGPQELAAHRHDRSEPSELPA